MTLSVVQVPAEELQRLFVGEDATVLHARGCEGYHHPGITVHPAKLIEVLVAQALGEHAVRTKPFYQLREVCEVNAFALRFSKCARSRQSPKSLRTSRRHSGTTSAPSISSSSVSTTRSMRPR